MSGIMLAFLGASFGGGAPPVVVFDGSFSGAPMAVVAFGG
jgi:hypothetical protein